MLREMKEQEFEARTVGEWKAAAESALKGKSVDSLRTETYEGITLKPLYTKDDLPSKLAATSQRRSPKVAPRIWRNNWEGLFKALEEALEKGQECISFRGDDLDPEGFPPFMEKILAKGKDADAFFLTDRDFSLMNAWKTEKGGSFSGVFGWDPVSQGLFSGGYWDVPAWIRNLETIHGFAPALKPIIIDLSPYHRQGAHAVQELALALSEGVLYIDVLLKQGWTMDQIAGKIHIHFAVGSQFFMELAKMRAFSSLWKTVIQTYGDDSTERGSMSAETSPLNKSRLDPYVNMLRSGGEAFASTLGGVDYIDVQPFDGSGGSVLGERMARNIPMIIGEESHLDKVIDPGAGSYYIEWLTEEVGRRAWKEFVRIQESGGVIPYIESGDLARDLEAVHAERLNDLSSGKSTLIGTNAYANPEDTLLSVEDDLLGRLSLPYERLRVRAQRIAERGSKPIAGIIGLGDWKDYKARADFTKGFLAVGGIYTKESSPCHTKSEILRFIEETRYSYYVICGTDAEYDRFLPEASESIIAIDPGITLDIAGSRTAPGMNGSIRKGMDALEKLDRLLSIWEEGMNDDEQA
ncbi:methylmalonyl-CoA mutase family protein [Rossellomorea marisflavi]|jgi:methylmalonyl-CoA mutase|uniref:methylmalonyl-CoA mutase family protein n=1 Tax=Rossellomorea marisflavi TaxID=189381 RepID=UPI0028535724|nr:methylmalonyl-CoA mutase family protein [Rossellomorea marisflavi]MDR4936386.1 methylmalonyl-CoA mutase family protein [Rossellomorea marisflavi]